jgi:hypothetical protein
MWTALYEDGTYIPQFEEDGREHLFKEIDETKLVEMVVTTEQHQYSVNLRRGSFLVNDLAMKFNTFENLKGYRLIYFRRVQRHMGSGGEDTEEETTQEFVGWQITTEDGKNHKRYIAINEHGLITVMEK